MNDIVNSASDFLNGKSRPTVNVGFDLPSMAITMIALLATLVISGAIVKKI